MEKIKRIKWFSALTIVITLLCIIPIEANAASSKAYIYLDSLKPIETARYTGNQGDSFVYRIGRHRYTRGNTDINGKSYSHGLEAWIARWNYTTEKSWAYSTYNVNKKYKKLSGKVVLIDSYNTTKFNTTLYFYGDGRLLKKYTMRPNNIPFNFSVNVSGVKKLKVYVKDNAAVSGGTSFGLTGCKLYKANPPTTPTVTSVTKKTGKIIGKTSKNVTVYVRIGTTTYSTKSDSSGKYSIKTKKLRAGTEIKIYAKNKYKQASGTKTIIVY